MTKDLTVFFAKLLKDPKARASVIEFMGEQTTPSVLNKLQDLLEDEDKLAEFLETEYSEIAEQFSSKARDVVDQTTIKEFEALIDDTKTRETDMRKFIKKHPWVLGVKYKKTLDGKQLDKNIPDYLLSTVDGRYDIAEIKGPNDRIFDGKTKTLKLNQYFVKGLLQLMHYVDYCDEHQDYFKSSEGLNLGKTSGIIVMDRELTEEERSCVNMMNSFINRISIKTYHQLLAEAVNAAEYLN